MFQEAGMKYWTEKPYLLTLTTTHTPNIQHFDEYTLSVLFEECFFEDEYETYEDFNKKVSELKQFFKDMPFCPLKKCPKIGRVTVVGRNKPNGLEYIDPIYETKEIEIYKSLAILAIRESYWSHNVELKIRLEYDVYASSIDIMQNSYKVFKQLGIHKRIQRFDVYKEDVHGELKKLNGFVMVKQDIKSINFSHYNLEWNVESNIPVPTAWTDDFNLIRLSSIFMFND
jgi:hypothetical protein